MNGYSPPWQTLWTTVQPNTATLDAPTDEWPWQRIGDIKPSGQGGDGQVSVTFSLPPGGSMTISTSILPQVVWASSFDVCYSSFYGGYVECSAVWRWRLTGYDSSGTNYDMAGFAEMESLNPLVFAVRIKANAYLATPRGLLDAASSGEKSMYFMATTTTLEALGPP